jgi:hypothetical protein
VWHGEPAAGQKLGVRQGADDRVLYTARGERIDEIPAVLELALEVFPVVGDPERTIAAAQRGAQGYGIVQIAATISPPSSAIALAAGESGRRVRQRTL